MKAFRTRGPLDPERADLATLWELGCRGMVEEGADVLAYFDELRALPLPGRWEAVEEVDWVREYTAGLRPVRAGTVVVAPTHAEARLVAGDTVVWLDPGSAFGTGHHETTRMALEALAGGDLVGRSVLDVGAGSGLLAIAAGALGARLSLGVDTDPSAVVVARANAVRNRSRARFLVGSLDHPELPLRFDIIVANLYAELHATLLPSYAERLVPGGELWLSGILGEREALVRAAAPASLRAGAARRDGAWAMLRFERVAP